MFGVCTKLICPPQAQVHLDSIDAAGMPITVTLAAGGAQGAGTTGMQGIGVSTPIAADVAAETCGFDIDVHIAKGMMLVIGTIMFVVRTGMFIELAWFIGTTDTGDGAVPNEHWQVVPCVTSIGMAVHLSRSFGDPRAEA